MNTIQQVNVRESNNGDAKLFKIEEANSVQAFKSDFRKIYCALVDHKLLLKRFHYNSVYPTFEFIINNNPISTIKIRSINEIQYKIVDRVFSNSDEVVPVGKQHINEFIDRIHSSLNELWNLSTTFDELEFLLFHINNMPPLLEISSKSKEEMLIKIEDIKSHYHRGLTKVEKVQIDETWKGFESKNLEKLKGLISQHLLEDDWDNIEVEDRIALMIELLGSASLSKKIQNPIDEFGEIALNIEALKKFHKHFRKSDKFKAFSKKTEDCLSYKITSKDYRFDGLLAKVFYHEFGHLYFGHCNRSANNIKDPKEVRESYANFFASLVFDSQKKSTFIWIMTRFQLHEYKFPKLIKMSKDYDVMSDKSNISSFNCTHNKIKSFIDFAVEERELRIKNGGLYK